VKTFIISDQKRACGKTALNMAMLLEIFGHYEDMWPRVAHEYRRDAGIIGIGFGASGECAHSDQGLWKMTPR